MTNKQGIDRCARGLTLGSRHNNPPPKCVSLPSFLGTTTLPRMNLVIEQCGETRCTPVNCDLPETTGD